MITKRLTPEDISTSVTYFERTAVGNYVVNTFRIATVVMTVIECPSEMSVIDTIHYPREIEDEYLVLKHIVACECAAKDQEVN